MAQNLQLDPIKKDYVVVDGSPVPSDRVLEAGYYALQIPQGKRLYGETGQGSNLYTLEGIRRSASIEQRFATISNEAIDRQLIKTGKATAVQTVNLAVSRTGTSNQIQIIPNNVQLSDQLNFISVG